MFKDINKFIQKNTKQKGKIIKRISREIIIPKNIDLNLADSYRIKETINKFVSKYIKQKKSSQTPNQIYDDIRNQFESFEKNYIEEVLPEKLKEIPTNLYKMSNATIFSTSNLVTRSLSTKMGHLWERVANCSNVTLSTEAEFDLKIKGVDIIFIKNDKPFYAQLKTLEGTLTGSQQKRSEQELSIHNNAIFIAAFDTGTGWTFNSKKIQRIKGEEFWSQINIDYDFLLECVKKMIKNIENSFVELRD